MSVQQEVQKASLKSADTAQKDDTRNTLTGGVEKPASGVPEGVTKPSAPATTEGEGKPSGGIANKSAEETGGKEGEKKEEKEGSESLVRGSYLPANKLKEAPPAEKYEGKDPMEFAKDSGVGTGAQIKEKLVGVKEKITHVGKKDSSS